MATLNAARGLVTSSNELSRPEGALTTADNIVVDFDNTIQKRRGFEEYSASQFSNSPKQLFTYKNRVMVHYASKLSFDSNGSGTFTDFSGSFNELVAGLRVKSVEASGNFYFTTSDGVKKVSAKTAADLSTATVTNAGGIKAIDLTGKLLPDTAGFLPAQSKVSYRVRFGTKDANSNLILGYPSSRLVLSNSSSDNEQNEILTINVLNYSAITDSQYLLFNTVQEGYFVWFNKTGTGTEPLSADTIGRTPVEVKISTATTNAQAATSLADALTSIGSELITTELSGAEVELSISGGGNVDDVAQGTLSAANVLVTKVMDGEKTTGTASKAELTFILPAGITTDYFYQIYRTGATTADVAANQTLADVDPGDEQQYVYEAPITSADITAGSITVEDNTPEAFRASGAYLETNQFSGQGIAFANERPPIATDVALFRNSVFYANTKEAHRASLTVLSVDDFVSGSTKLYISQGATTRDYTFVGDVEITDVTVDSRTNTVAGSYFVINSANDDRSYYVWFDTTGTTTDPQVANKYGIRVQLNLYGDSVAETKLALLDALALNPDFTAVDNGGSVIRITCTDSGNVAAPSLSSTPAPGGAWAISTFAQGAGEDAATRKVLLSVSSSVATSIDLTARSLVKIINKDTLCPVYATYLSGADDLPGKIQLEAKSLADQTFYVAVNSSILTAEFSPEVPYYVGSGAFPTSFKSDSNETPNRIYFSKTNQPEAVPIVNYIDIGSKDKQILRILALRDNLFVLKEDGVYIVTGASAPNFSVRLLDNSATLTAPDSAVVLNNLIYCLTTQGVVSISETGVSIISRQIEDQIKKVTTYQYSFSTTAFGLAYESDRSYLLWLPTLKSDTYATQCFRYNTVTSTWTRWTLANICGLVNPGDDRIYLGKADPDRRFVEQERKTGGREDYADRSFTKTISNNGVNETTISINSVIDVEPGDVLVQYQYLTAVKFNRLLSRLDNDPGVTDTDYRTSLEVGQGNDLGIALSALIAKLNADASLGTFTASSGLNNYITVRNEFNVLIGELNGIPSGTTFKDYKTATDLLAYEVLVEDTNSAVNQLTVNFSTWLVAGDCGIFKAIKTEVEWAAQHFGTPETTKQIDRGTLIFDQGTIYGGTVAYSSDRSADFTSIDFELSGPGFWGSYNWADTCWGGGSNEVPVVTLIPRDKSRCRYIHVKFIHKNAREQFKLLGISLEPREVSKRGYR